MYDASLELSFDAGALKPIYLADGGELAVEQGVALDLSKQRVHVVPRDGVHVR